MIIKAAVVLNRNDSDRQVKVRVKVLLFTVNHNNIYI